MIPNYHEMRGGTPEHLYSTPSIEITVIETEQCFATSRGWNDALNDDPLHWEYDNQFE